VRPFARKRIFRPPSPHLTPHKQPKQPQKEDIEAAFFRTIQAALGKSRDREKRRATLFSTVTNNHQPNGSTSGNDVLFFSANFQEVTR